MKRLSTKITVFYAVSIISIVLVSCLILYFNIKNSLTEDMETYLKQEIVIKGLTLNSDLEELEKNRDELIDKIKKFKVFDTGYYLLMDTEFNMIYHPDDSIKNLYTVADGSLSFLADNIKDSDENFGSINYNYKNEMKILSFYKLDNGWILASAPVRDEMYSNLNNLTKLVSTLAGILIILGLSSAYILGRSISNRMLSINKMAKSISDGNLDIGKNHIKSKDEIGELERAFYEIVDNIKSLNFEIDNVTNSIYEGELDKRADENKYKGFLFSSALLSSSPS
jgi:methyl-accepting chemotaxis protein